MDNQRLSTLLAGTAQRDASAFSQLYQEFSPTVYGIALSVVKEPHTAADAAQEVFLRLWTLPPARFPRENPGAWLYTVTRRQALEHLQRQRPQSLEEAPPLPELSSPLEKALDWQSFQELLAPLDELSRQIVTLKLAAGYTHREIAALLHQNPATVRWKYMKAIHGLRLFWADLLGALLLGFLGLRALLPQAPTAGAPARAAPAASPRQPLQPGCPGRCFWRRRPSSWQGRFISAGSAGSVPGKKSETAPTKQASRSLS